MVEILLGQVTWRLGIGMAQIQGIALYVLQMVCLFITQEVFLHLWLWDDLTFLIILMLLIIYDYLIKKVRPSESLRCRETVSKES